MGVFHLISGNEDFSVKERASALIRSLCGDPPENNPDLEIIRGDEDSERFSVPLDRVMESIETPSFLSPSKTIWLKHFNKIDDALSESSTKKKPSRIDRLSALLKAGLPPDVTLVMDISGLDRRKTFYKVCEKACEATGGKLEWFEKTDMKMKGAAAILIRNAKEYAASAGKRLDEEAASYIAGAAGSDVPAMHTEIDKLAAYTEGSPVITLADCREVCSRTADVIAWEFSGALSERNPVRALELIPGIIETMEQERGSSSRPELAIMGGANSEFKRILSLRCEGEKFHIPRNASPDFFYRLFDEYKGKSDSPLFSMHPYHAFVTWKKTVLFTDAELAHAFRSILDANLAMVTGGDPRLALETLVLNIAETNA